MDIENTKVQMRKGILEYCVLQIISKGEIYTSDLIDRLTKANLMVVEGTLYPLLTRLKNAEILDYKWIESKTGPPRKYYILTAKGNLFLLDLAQTWQELSSSVKSVLETPVV
jgi:PadR family transcriptional regulator, regulatory protein PadR